MSGRTKKSEGLKEQCIHEGSGNGTSGSYIKGFVKGERRVEGMVRFSRLQGLLNTITIE